jgi:hypothetical protein
MRPGEYLVPGFGVQCWLHISTPHAFKGRNISDAGSTGLIAPYDKAII